MIIIRKILNRFTLVYQQVKWRRKMFHFGKKSRLIKPLIIHHPECLKIGSNVNIGHFARIEAICSWHNNQIFEPLIEIGNNSSFEQDLHLICANRVLIGNNCVISARVFISDLNHEYFDISACVMNQKLLVKDVLIEDGSFVGYGACILPGVHLGKHCVVGVNAVVTKSFPDYCVIAGNPAVCIKKYSIKKQKWLKTDINGEFLE